MKCKICHKRMTCNEEWRVMRYPRLGQTCDECRDVQCRIEFRRQWRKRIAEKRWQLDQSRV